MITKKQQRTGHLALLGSNVMWGVMAPISKFVLAGGLISSALLTDLRIFAGTVLFWLASMFIKAEKVDRKDYIRFFGAALFSTTLNQICYVRGVSLTSPVNSTICTSTLPIWTMLMAAAYLREPVTGKKAAGVFLGLCGALVLVLFGSIGEASGTSNIWGDILCLLSQVCYGIYLVFFQDIIRKYSPVTLMKWKYTFAALMLLPFAFTDFYGMDFSALPSQQWAGLAYILLCGTFLSYMIVPLGQKYLRPTIVAMYNYLQPIAAAVVAIIWGLDSFSPVKLLAVLLIFAGVLLVNRSKAAETDAKSDR